MSPYLLDNDEHLIIDTDVGGPRYDAVEKAYAPLTNDSYVPGTHNADPTAEMDRQGLDPTLEASSMFGTDLLGGLQ